MTASIPMPQKGKTYLPHPIYSKPIETVEELSKAVESQAIKASAETLTDLIRDSYDAHAEKPLRGAIRTLVRLYLTEQVFTAAYAQKNSLNDNLTASCLIGEGNFREVGNELRKKRPNPVRINHILGLVENEIEVIRTQIPTLIDEN